MNFNLLFIGVMAALIAYAAGYQGAAVWIVIFSLIVSFASGFGKKKPSKSKGLEPIIIESTRGAPYKIPSEMVLKFKPDASLPSTEAEKAAGKKGVLNILGRSIGKGIRSIFKED